MRISFVLQVIQCYSRNRTSKCSRDESQCIAMGYAGYADTLTGLTQCYSEDKGTLVGTLNTLWCSETADQLWCSETADQLRTTILTPYGLKKCHNKHHKLPLPPLCKQWSTPPDKNKQARPKKTPTGILICCEHHIFLTSISQRECLTQKHNRRLLVESGFRLQRPTCRKNMGIICRLLEKWRIYT